NDHHGHLVGDAVLKTGADTLSRRHDPDIIAFRLGGEEFRLMLRGRKGSARADRLREAIGRAIAEHQRLGFAVTASMGVVEAPLEALPKADFSMLYKRADRLLYEAKSAGRNRTVSESFRVFHPRQADRRAA